jgi:hypothetical protein
MQENSSVLPPSGGPEKALLSSCASKVVESRALSRLRFSVAGRRSSRSFWSALALALLAGAALGMEFGLRAGSLAPPARGRISETVSLDAAGAAEVARLRDDVRALRAQIEQLRHLVEISKTSERIKALEAAHDAGVAQSQLAAATAARLGGLEARLERLEHASVDTTPTSLIQRSGSKKPARDRQAAGGAPAD